MWETELIEILRVLVDDMEETKYTDVKLKRLLIVAAYQVLREADFSQDFVVDVSEQSILPDPTNTGVTRDDSFVNLTCLKAACIADRGQAVTAAAKAVAGRDSISSFDLRGVSEARLKLLSVGFCKSYEDELDRYVMAGNSEVAGAAVMTPFRTAANHYYGGGGSLYN